MAVASVLDPQRTKRSSVALLGKNSADQRIDTDHGHAHYLAWSFDPNSRGRLDTIVVWVPAGITEEEVSVLRQVQSVRGPRFRSCPVQVEAIGPINEVAPSMVGGTPDPDKIRPARRWRSATPYAPPRNIRRQETWDDHARSYLERDLARAGKPPVTIQSVDGPWSTFERRRRREAPGNDRRATGFTLEFVQPVLGPICAGALRHFGLGLFLPTD